MDVSVIIPTYNRAELLPITLRTVLAQTLAPREIIVVDDGSTDDTGGVLADFGPRVRVITIPNSGSIVARNVGLRSATGDYVAFCDSDDLWRPGFLRHMATLWQAEPRTKVGFGNFQIVIADNWEPGSKFIEAPANFWAGFRNLGSGIGVFEQSIVGRLLTFQPFFPSALVAPREAFITAGGWDEGVGRTVGDDFATALRLAEQCPFGVAHTPLVGIRKHPGNFSADVRRMNLGDANILEYVLATRPSLAVHREEIEASVGQRRLDALENAFAAGDLPAVQAIYALLPNRFRSPRIRVKRLIASLPPRVADKVGWLALTARLS